MDDMKNDVLGTPSRKMKEIVWKKKTEKARTERSKKENERNFHLRWSKKKGTRKKRRKMKGNNDNKKKRRKNREVKKEKRRKKIHEIQNEAEAILMSTDLARNQACIPGCSTRLLWLPNSLTGNITTLKRHWWTWYWNIVQELSIEGKGIDSSIKQLSCFIVSGIF